jgi:hypothetical protein
MDVREGTQKILDEFGSRIGFLGYQIINLSLSGQSCDVTFYKRKAALDVKIDPKINIALMYGAGADKLQELLEHISLSNGEVVSINDIWVINPMPNGGISQEELASADLSLGDQKVGASGETMREVIRQVYHCESAAEEELFLRRYIAS